MSGGLISGRHASGAGVVVDRPHVTRPMQSDAADRVAARIFRR
jgi:hypothetical protein